MINVHGVCKPGFEPVREAFIANFEKGLDVVHICPSAVYGPSPVHVGLNSFFIKLLNRQSPVLPPGGLSIVYIDGCAKAQLAAAEVGVAGERYLVSDTHVTNPQLAKEILAQSDLRNVPPVAPTWLVKGVAAGSEMAHQCQSYSMPKETGAAGESGSSGT